MSESATASLTFAQSNVEAVFKLTSEIFLLAIDLDVMIHVSPIMSDQYQYVNKIMIFCMTADFVGEMLDV